MSERTPLLDAIYDQLHVREAEEQLRISEDREVWYRQRAELFRAYLARRQHVEAA